jgi:hypothetical protein
MTAFIYEQYGMRLRMRVLTLDFVPDPLGTVL